MKFKNLYKWNSQNNNEINLAKFISKYPDREILEVKRVSLKRKYYTKILSEKIEKEKRNYFINFDIAESKNNETFYVKGSLIYEKKISLSNAKILIKNALPKGYTPINFYEAEESTEELEKKPRLILIRDENTFFNEELNI